MTGAEELELSPLAAAVVRFSRYLRVGSGDLVGRPLRLLDWQVRFIARALPADRHVRTAILSIARKNGKTALVAVLVLAALLGPLARRNGLVISAARSQQQARLVFAAAVKILTATRLLHLVVIRESAGEIHCPGTGVTYRAVAADASLQLGEGPFIVIHDELGAVRGPRDALYSALATSLGAYEQALEIIISTQAESDADLLSTLIDQAESGADPSMIVELYAAEEDADPWAEATWKQANPALGVFRSVADMRAQAARARLVPALEAKFRNLLLNQRIASESQWLSRSSLERCARPPDPEAFRRFPVYGGLDLSMRQDLSALVLVAEDDEGDVHVDATLWTPAQGLAERAHGARAPLDLWVEQGWLRACPGLVVRYPEIARELVRVAREYELRAINFDRWRIRELLRELELLEERGELELPFTPREGTEGGFVELVHCGQGYRDMTPALESVEELALHGRLRLGPNPLLRWCLSNARVVTDPANGRKLDKRRQGGKIDAAVALAMACKALKVDGQERGGIATGDEPIFA